MRRVEKRRTDNLIEVEFAGSLSLSDEDVLRFHPEVGALLREIESKGWKYSLENINGRAVAQVALKKAPFTLHYYPPRLEEFERKGKYTLEVDLGSREPSTVKIVDVRSFEIRIATKHAWHAASINPFNHRITHVEDILQGVRWGREKEPQKLAEAREVYEVAKWLVETKGFKLKDHYVAEHYKDLIDRFEKRYTFPLRLHLTVHDEAKVPSWDRLQKDLAHFMSQRGLLMKVVQKPRPFAEKPIP